MRTERFCDKCWGERRPVEDERWCWPWCDKCKGRGYLVTHTPPYAAKEAVDRAAQQSAQGGA